MKHALLFREGENPILVSAEDIKNGLYNRKDQFVDPDYEFRVQYVSSGKNHSGPYFRYYYSYEDYKRLYPDRADRYKIVLNMRRYQESQWHMKWKNNVADFCELEKCIRNSDTQKWKFADAYFIESNTCFEFQHSYIAWDFEDRNTFYSNLGINTVWLYDLPNANVKHCDGGEIEILEDNAKGFFRVSENPNNLKDHPVYIQVKSGMIYRVTELFRREIESDRKSTIRYFYPSEHYTEAEFISAIRGCRIPAKEAPAPKKIAELWESGFVWMVVQNVETGDKLFINRNDKGEMFRDYQSGCIKYKYADNKYDTLLKDRYEYHLSFKKENEAIWILCEFRKE